MDEGGTSKVGGVLRTATQAEGSTPPASLKARSGHRAERASQP
jgi:hypothetical protein